MFILGGSETLVCFQNLGNLCGCTVNYPEVLSHTQRLLLFESTVKIHTVKITSEKESTKSGVNLAS